MFGLQPIRATTESFAKNKYEQEIIPYSEKLANYICNKKELKQIKTSKNKNNELTKLWVKKESYIKLKGKTIC